MVDDQLRFYQDAISEIPWWQYGLSQNTQSSADCMQEDVDDRLVGLRSVENQLRLAGHHVVLEEVSATLWLFDLSEVVGMTASTDYRQHIVSQAMKELDLIGMSRSGNVENTSDTS